jgi:hypothetical protein
MYACDRFLTAKSFRRGPIIRSATLHVCHRGRRMHWPNAVNVDRKCGRDYTPRLETLIR